jgi:hypothetical protein
MSLANAPHFINDLFLCHALFSQSFFRRADGRTVTTVLPAAAALVSMLAKLWIRGKTAANCNETCMVQYVFQPPMERAGRLIARLKLPQGAVSHERLACAAWPVAVSDRIARHARAVSLVRSRLVVEVEDIIWQRQLFSLRGPILKKLGQVIGEPIVTEIEFRIAIPRRLPQRAEQSKITADEADRIEDPVLRRIYKENRKRASA